MLSTKTLTVEAIMKSAVNTGKVSESEKKVSLLTSSMDNLNQESNVQYAIRSQYHLIPSTC